MVSSKEFKQRAWSSLKGKYSNAIAVCFLLNIVLFISGIISMLGRNISGQIINQTLASVSSVLTFLMSLLIENPLNIGVNNYFIKNTDSSPEFSEMFSSFKHNYKYNVKVMFVTQIKIMLWTLLFVIPGIIKSYEYAMVPYILADNPDLENTDVLMLSKNMMDGNKFALFRLEFSFFGWIFLASFTFGIGMIFLLPYMNAATAEFYKEIKNNNL